MNVGYDQRRQEPLTIDDFSFDATMSGLLEQLAAAAAYGLRAPLFENPVGTFRQSG